MAFTTEKKMDELGLFFLAVALLSYLQVGLKGTISEEYLPFSEKTVQKINK